MTDSDLLDTALSMLVDFEMEVPCEILTDKDDTCNAMRDRIEWLMQEILDALREPEPRVLNATEVADCPDGTVLWVEERQGVTWNLFPLEIDVSSIHPDTGTAYLFFVTYHDLRKFECDEYNQTWRCWSARPSDERRRAEAWEKS